MTRVSSKLNVTLYKLTIHKLTIGLNLFDARLCTSIFETRKFESELSKLNYEALLKCGYGAINLVRIIQFLVSNNPN